MSRNWQDSFQKGQGFAPKIIDQLTGIEVDLATALAGGGAVTDGTTLDINGSGQLEVKPGGIDTTQLANAGPGATGPIGSSTTTPVITIDAKGRVTALTSAAITGTGGAVFLASTYGAKLDGVTDDSAAIQSAIDACNAAGGGEVLIDGSTDIQGHGATVKLGTTLRLKSGVWLRGQGSSTDIRSSANPVIAFPTSGTLLERVAVSDMSIGNCPGTGIYLDPTGLSGGLQLGWTRCTIENVTVADAGGTAFQTILGGGVLEIRFINCVSLRAAGDGFSILSTDDFLLGCTAAQGSGRGFVVGANTKLVGSKGYGNASHGFFLTGSGRCSIAGCESQDNAGYGFYITDSALTNAISGCVSDTDGLGSLYIGSPWNIIDLQCEYGGGGTGQHTKTWVFFDAAATANSVRIGGRFDFTDVAFITGNVDGNNVEAGGWNARKAYAYSSSFTPEPYKAGFAAITLTGNITIAEPIYKHAGQEMTFEFTQDSTGGRTVTFPAQWRTNWTPDTTAGKTNVIRFRYDGAGHWHQVYAATGVAADANIASDTFTRSNGALGTADSGQTYSTTGTAPVISSNQAVGAGGGSALIDATRSDASVSMTLQGTGAFQYQLIARYTDANNYIALGSNNLVQVSGGVQTQLIGATFNWNTVGQVATLRVSGGTASVYINGSLVGTARTDVVSGTKFGFGMVLSSEILDNLVIV